MRYLSEDPWPLVTLFGVAALGLLIALRLTQQGKYLVRAGIAAALALGVLAIEHFWVTDNERIEFVVRDLERALRASDAEAINAYLTPDVAYVRGGSTLLEGEDVRERIRQELARLKFDLVSISHLETEVGRQTRLGRAVFRVAIAGTYKFLTAVNFAAVNTEWDLGFQETDPGVWKVNRITPTRLPRGNPLP